MKNFHAYTDGSCSPNPGKGGWAWVIYYSTSFGALSFRDYGGKQKTTNNEMELMAMLELLRFLQKEQEPYKIIIHSDSEYVLKGLVDGGNGLVGKYPRGRCYGWEKDEWKTKKGWRANHLLWQKIIRECERCYKDGIILDMVWVKGHSGDEGNDLVDKLANQARPK
jgi:ribonuclease HI